MIQKKTENLVVIYILTKLELGGAQKVCLTLFDTLPTNNITTYLITGTQGILTQLVQDKKNIIFLPTLLREVHWYTFFTEIKNFFMLIKHLKNIKKNHNTQTTTFAVHTHSTKAGIIGRWAAFFAGIPCRIHTIHGYAFHSYQNLFVWLAIYFLECITSFITTHFICVSIYDMYQGKRILPGFKRKASIIRAGVDSNQFVFKPAQKSDTFNNLFIFGTISCLKQQKNLFDLIKAFQLVYQNNISARLEIIGDGLLRPQLENVIKQYHLENVVTLHGWQLEPANIMKNWDTFVLSSLWEGLPCSIIEARLLQLPIISYKTGGIPDVVKHGKNGFLCPQKEWRKLAYCMLEISTNKKLYQKLHTFKDDLHDFDNKYMVAKHRELYQKLGLHE